MRSPDCSAGGESRKRSAGWAGCTAGSNKRSAEKLSASRNRGSSCLVRMMITASEIPSPVINNCRTSSKPRIHVVFQRLTNATEFEHRNQRQKADCQGYVEAVNRPIPVK